MTRSRRRATHAAHACGTIFQLNANVLRASHAGRNVSSTLQSIAPINRPRRRPRRLAAQKVERATSTLIVARAKNTFIAGTGPAS